MKREYKIGGQVFEIGHLEKVFYPEAGVTKGDVVDYYERVAEVMLPYLKGRPLNMQRAPEGMRGGNFYQHEMGEYFPKWIAHRKVPRRADSPKGKSIDHVICQDKATLVYLAGQAAVTLHTWLSSLPLIGRPDQLVFDLDPPGNDFEIVRLAARETKKFLDEIRVESFLMTTGSRGLHVVVPLRAEANFEKAREVGKRMASAIAERRADKLTTEFFKRKRRGRLFMDYTRNAYGVTTVAPYTVRLRTGAPVATPIEWEELGDKDLNSKKYTVKNIFRRLGRKEDPWRKMLRKRGKLTVGAIEKRLGGLDLE